VTMRHETIPDLICEGLQSRELMNPDFTKVWLGSQHRSNQRVLFLRGKVPNAAGRPTFMSYAEA
jgi:hypothetical protein